MLKIDDVAEMLADIDMIIADLTTYDRRQWRKLPTTNNIQEVIAGEVWLASRVAKRGAAILRAKQELAVKEEVFVDKESSGIDPGTSAIIFSGEHFLVNCTVKNPATGFDPEAARKKMAELKIPKAKIDAIMEAGQKTHKPPHTFDAFPRPFIA